MNAWSETVEIYSQIPLENWIMGAVALLIMGAVWCGKAFLIALLARWATKGWRK